MVTSSHLLITCELGNTLSYNILKWLGGEFVLPSEQNCVLEMVESLEAKFRVNVGLTFCSVNLLKFPKRFHFLRSNNHRK